MKCVFFSTAYGKKTSIQLPDMEVTVGETKKKFADQEDVNEDALIFMHSGRHLDDNKKLSFYNICFYTTIHVHTRVTRSLSRRTKVVPTEYTIFRSIPSFFFDGGEPRIEDTKISNVQSTGSENMKEMIKACENGPLFKIFEFLDPLEILICFRGVCKAFNRLFVYIITRPGFRFNDYHLHLMLGRANKKHINEKLFVYLCGFDNLWKIENKVSPTDPDKTRFSKFITMKQVCQDYGWNEAILVLQEK